METRAQELYMCHLNGWTVEDLLGYVYGEDCEFEITRRNATDSCDVVCVRCSDGSVIKFVCGTLDNMPIVKCFVPQFHS